MPRPTLPEGVKRTDLFTVDPRNVVLEKGYNPRQDFDTNFEELVLSIMENQVKNPIKVQIKKGKVVVRDGERRIRACLEAIKRGHEIKTVKAMLIPETMTEVNCLFESYVANDSLPFSAIEEATLFKRLFDGGYSLEEIGKRIGRSQIYVKERIVLCDATPELKQAVREKKVGKTLASKIVKESKGDANFQNELTKEAKKGKKGKRTVKRVLESKSTVKEEKKEKRERAVINTEEIRDLFKAEKASLNKVYRDSRKDVWEVSVQYGRVLGIAEVLEFDTNSLADKFKSYLKSKKTRRTT